MQNKSKLIITGLIAGLVIATCGACGAPKQESETTSYKSGTEESQPVSNPETENKEAIDFSSANWIGTSLDCYGYTADGEPCFIGFPYPEQFQSEERNDDGEQYRGYWYAENGGTAAESQYGIYAYFLQGGYGAHKESLEEGLVGGKFEKRKLGGKTVYFGQMDDSANPDASGYTYCYYLPYDKDDWARAWILVQDQEENGMFREMFEKGLSFENRDMTADNNTQR